jgi:competence protein ComEC
LALSGLHLMIIYTLITLLLGRRRLRLTTQVLTVLAVWAFALLVGLSPSVTRAAFMITVYALLSLGYRERMSVNTLAFVAMVMLMFNPYALFDIGFQLSFAAVLSILLFHPLLVKFIPSHLLQRHRWLNMLWSMTIVSVSAQIGTAPLVAYTFGRFATTFLLANYIVIPLATLVLYLTLACVLTWWWSAVQWWIAKGLSVIVLLMNRLLEYMASWSFSSIEAVQLSATQVVLLYVLIGCLYYFIRLGQTTHSVSWNKLVEKDSDK